MKKAAILLSLSVFLAISCVEKMQEFQVSNVCFSPCQQSKLRSSENSIKADVVFTDKGVKITHYNFEVTCDFTDVNVTHTFVNGVLRITQQSSPNLANCVCYTDVSYTINGILKEEVNVIFINGVQVYCYNDDKHNKQLVLTLRPDGTKGKDAVFGSIVPDNNYATSEDIHLYAWTHDGILTVNRVAIDFDLSSIPSGSVIDSALLSLYYNKTSRYGNQQHSGKNDFLIKRITSPWDQNTVTWRTQPTATSQNQVFVPGATFYNQNFPNIDMTKLVQDMINDKADSHGFLFQLQKEEPYTILLIASSDHPNESIRPKLEVYYKIKK